MRWVTVYLVLPFAAVSSIFNAGLYNLKLTAVEQCADPGSGEISFSVKKYQPNSGNSMFSANGTLGIPLDDNIDGELNISRILQSGERILVMRFNQKKVCEFAETYFPKVVEKFAKRLGIDPPTCYLAAGNYTLNDIDSDLPPSPYFPVWTYGEYLIVATAFTGDTSRKIGCVESYVSVLRRQLFT